METKVCCYCAEEIKIAARLCPFCQRSQSGTYFGKDSVAVIIIALIFLGTFLFCVKLITRKRDFSAYREEIFVLGSSLQVSANTNNPHPKLLGLATNSSSHAWSAFRFEVRFFDKRGEMIDTEDEIADFTMLPRSDHAFTISLFPRKTVPEHASYKVLVKHAIEPGVVW